MILDLNRDVVLGLETRAKRQIENSYCKKSADAGDVLAVNDLKKKYPKAKHRPVDPSPAYNCHGLTFASRRTFVVGDISQIIKDDGYVQLNIEDKIWPGDIAVYIEEGSIVHSGVVVWQDDQGSPWILSKWGKLHEVIHKPRDCPYSEYNVCYYRLKK